MYRFDVKETDGKKVFSLHGKIDSSNSEEVASLILPSIMHEDNIVFDFEDVPYISSAGLRFVLKVAKIPASFKVINAVNDVYDIFDMTGFTQIIKVEKALRVLSIEGKEMIGEGYMGRVYRLDPDTIIKVYYRAGADSISDIEREIGLAKKAFVLGIPTAIPFDVVKVKEGGYGSVFELLKSKSFNKLFIEHPEDLDKHIKMYVDLLKIILSTIVDDDSLPNKNLLGKAYAKSLRERKAFDEPVLDKIDALVATIPDQKTLIHGDYHIKNIMMQGDEPLLIDMDTIGCGHPIYEFAGFFLTYIGYPATDAGNSKAFLGIDDEVAQKLFYSAVDGIYSDRSEQERKEIIDKIALFSYIWFVDKTMTFEPNNLKRLNHAKEQVLSLIDKYDTLNF